MKSGIFFICLISILLFGSCGEMSLTNHPLRGTIHVDETGKKFEYRSVKTSITNNDNEALRLQLSYPRDQIDNIFRLILLPDSAAPELQFDDLSGHLSKGLVTLINDTSIQPRTLNRIIKPGESNIINTGLLFSPDVSDSIGLVRAEFYLEKNQDKSGYDIFLNMGITNPIYWKRICCGQMVPLIPEN
jgi:hypothetical protein